jgi:hypothetical protein
MSASWIKLHRKSLGSRVFGNPSLWRLWTWALLRANYRPGRFRGEDIPVGSFATGMRAAAEALGTSTSSVHRGLRRLAEWNMVVLEVKRDFTIVSVCNYSTYQRRTKRVRNEIGTQLERERNGCGTEAGTIEESKEPQEVVLAKKKTRKRCSMPPTFEEVAAYCTERTNGIDPEKFIDHYEANGWVQGRGKPIVDWKAAVRTWEKNSRSEAKPPPPRTSRMPTAEELKTWNPHATPQ